MKRSALQSTLREWQGHLRHPLTLTGVGGVAIILALAAPFDTEAFSLARRLVFWLAIAFCTYGVGVAVALLTRPVSVARLGPWAGAAVVHGVTGLTVTATVLLLDGALLGDWPRDAADFGGTSATVFGIAVIVSVLFGRFRGALVPDAAEAKSMPALMQRLPYAKRGRLIALSVEDHYVRVRTTQGEAMILMRLSDAIRETDPEPGMQVHRSHWVALWAVSHGTRGDGRGAVHLVGGVAVPVSRSNLAAAREAGLL